MTDCIIWPGHKGPKGYGQIRRGGKTYSAHVWVWMQKFGPVPKGMNICHKCDNPPCVNVDHLFMGTPKQNTQDAIAKGRYKFRHQHKVTPAIAIEIASAYTGKRGEQKLLAAQYGIHFSVISEIVRGKYPPIHAR